MKELADLYNQEQLPDKIMPRLIELLDNHLSNIKKQLAGLQSLDKEITEYRERIVKQYNLQNKSH